MHSTALVCLRSHLGLAYGQTPGSHGNRPTRLLIGVRKQCDEPSELLIVEREVPRGSDPSDKRRLRFHTWFAAIFLDSYAECFRGVGSYSSASLLRRPSCMSFTCLDTVCAIKLDDRTRKTSDVGVRVLQNWGQLRYQHLVKNDRDDSHITNLTLYRGQSGTRLNAVAVSIRMCAEEVCRREGTDIPRDIPREVSKVHTRSYESNYWTAGMTDEARSQKLCA